MPGNGSATVIRYREPGRARGAGPKELFRESACGRSAASPGYAGGFVVRWSGGGFEGDFVAEGVEVTDVLTFASFGAHAVAAPSRTGSQNSMVEAVEVQVGFIDRDPRHPVVTRTFQAALPRRERHRAAGRNGTFAPMPALAVLG